MVSRRRRRAQCRQRLADEARGVVAVEPRGGVVSRRRCARARPSRGSRRRSARRSRRARAGARSASASRGPTKLIPAGPWTSQMKSPPPAIWSTCGNTGARRGRGPRSACRTRRGSRSRHASARAHEEGGGAQPGQSQPTAGLVGRQPGEGSGTTVNAITRYCAATALASATRTQFIHCLHRPRRLPTTIRTRTQPSPDGPESHGPTRVEVNHRSRRGSSRRGS